MFLKSCKSSHRNVLNFLLHFTVLFQNLVWNAIKYRREEPPRVHISVHKDQKPSCGLPYVTTVWVSNPTAAGRSSLPLSDGTAGDSRHWSWSQFPSDLRKRFAFTSKFFRLGGSAS